MNVDGQVSVGWRLQTIPRSAEKRYDIDLFPAPQGTHEETVGIVGAGPRKQILPKRCTVSAAGGMVMKHWVAAFRNRYLLTARERSEYEFRFVYKLQLQCDLEDELSRHQASPEQISVMFDQLHSQYGQAILFSKDLGVRRTVMGQAMMAICRRLDMFAN